MAVWVDLIVRPRILPPSRAKRDPPPSRREADEGVDGEAVGIISRCFAKEKRMIKYLVRRWCGGWDSPCDPERRAEIGRRAGGVGIACNVLLAAAKLVVGLIAGSVAIIADAVNNFSDVASSAVTVFGFRLARRPADGDHPYGHARYEYLTGLMIAVLILFAGVEMLKSSFDKILHPTLPVLTLPAVIVLVLAMGMKLWMMLFYGALGRRIDSGTLLAASADSRNDVITTGAVLLGSFLGTFFSLPLDGYLGLGVAVYILISGIGIAKNTLSPLLGERVTPEFTEALEKIVLSHEKVLGSHDLLVHDYGAGQRYASIHLELDAEEDPLVCHDIIDDIEWMVLEQMNVHLVIHYDPVVRSDTEREEMYRLVEALLADRCPYASMHDFRLVRGARQAKLVFDLSVPYAMLPDCREIKARIDDGLAAAGKTYHTVIRFDGREG